jgi:transcriptional regulator with XRE-family HTH domain
MAGIKYDPVPHDHEAFLIKARKRKGFSEAYDNLEEEYLLLHEMLSARAKSGLTQEAVAERMGTTKSAVSRLESAGKHGPIYHYAQKSMHERLAVICRSN